MTEEEFNKKIKFTLIRRRDSIAYIEFMRGKYNFYEIDYLFNLFSIMTKYEILNLQKNHLINYGKNYGIFHYQIIFIKLNIIIQKKNLMN